MSLDVYLSRRRDLSEEELERLAASDLLRERGMDHAADFLAASVGDRDEQVFGRNITHNLGRMAAEAGLYVALWRPEEAGVARASQLAPLLSHGLNRLAAEPDRFRALDAPNGWGRYEDLLRFVQNYLAACEEYPEAEVSVSR